MSTQPVGQLPAAFAEQRLIQRIRDDPALYRSLRELFLYRRDQRRDQADATFGEQGQVLRGRCIELTAILNEVFPNVKET